VPQLRSAVNERREKKL